MNRKGKAVCALLLVQLLAWGVFVPTADAGKLIRLSSQFRRFDASFDSTTAGPSGMPGVGGIGVYTKSFSIPTPASGQQAVVFITMSAGTFTNGGGAIQFSCEMDASFCNPGSDYVGPTGWQYFVETDQAGISKGQVVHYTWCAKVSPGTHTARIRMASLTATTVYIFAAHFFIDWTQSKASTADDCEVGTP